MTTNKFSSITLPHPTYSLEVGHFNLGFDEDDNIRLPNMVPKFSDTAQVVEVRRSGSLLTPSSKGFHNFLGSCILIENARPELFVRRDFISKFVEAGTIHLAHNKRNMGYHICSKSNVMTITMSEAQYRRFGLIAKKASKNKATGEKHYKIEVDLMDRRIKKSNKFQDNLIKVLRRLSFINKLYFRFVPSKSSGLTNEAANDLSLEFFRYVIHEYEIDGVQPVPLSGCTKIDQQVQRVWTNYSQLHPNLSLCETSDQYSDNPEGGSNVGSAKDHKLSNVVEIIDWLGYQLLSIDCEQDEIRSNYDSGLNECERLDVSCAQIFGPMDCDHIQENFWRLFQPTVVTSSLATATAGTKSFDPDVIFRALLLYNSQLRNTGVILMQDCCPKLESEVTPPSTSTFLAVSYRADDSAFWK